MPAVVTFDPVNLLIREIDVGGDNEIDAIDVYSNWKSWLLSDFQNMGHPQAFRVVGGDSRSPTSNLGSTFFLMNGWKIKPAESDHKLTVVGNLFVDGGGESVFTPTDGAFTVHTETVVTDLISGLDNLFNRISSIDAQLVTIDAAIAAVAVAIASGTLTETQSTQLQSLFKAMALDSTDKWITTPSEMRTASGDIIIKLTGDGKTYTEGQRQ